MSKNLLLSKTFWLQALGVAALVTQTAAGEQVIPAEYQVAALLASNIVLRAATDEGVVVPGSGRTKNLVRRLVAAFRAFMQPLPPETP